VPSSLQVRSQSLSIYLGETQDQQAASGALSAPRGTNIPTPLTNTYRKWRLHSIHPTASGEKVTATEGLGNRCLQEHARKATISSVKLR